jgi:hypothetical protein
MQNNNTVDELQKLYDKGFRCIKYEDKDDEMDVYLKNFDSEESRHMKFKNSADKAYVSNYVNTYIALK